MNPDQPSELLQGAVLYVRDGCHLCGQFLLELEVEFGPAAESLQVVDVDADVELAVQFGLRVPVLALAGEVVCEGVYDASKVKRALAV